MTSLSFDYSKESSLVKKTLRDRIEREITSRVAVTVVWWLLQMRAIMDVFRLKLCQSYSMESPHLKN